MNIFRNALYGSDLTLLAIRTGLSVSCLYAIRAGRTKWPRWNTLETIMIPLNIRMNVRQY